MKYVYYLTHSHIVDYIDGDPIKDTKTIGYYSTYEKAQDTAERYKGIIGFKDYPDGFSIEKIEIDFDDYNFI